jgi:hypothetical protein
MIRRRSLVGIIMSKTYEGKHLSLASLVGICPGEWSNVCYFSTYVLYIFSPNWTLRLGRYGEWVCVQ